MWKRGDYEQSNLFITVDNDNVFDFVNKSNSMAVVHLCLGSTFLCLGSVYLNKNKEKKK